MNFPKATEVNRFIPKESFYKHAAFSPKLRGIFVNQIEKITWKNKIAPSTLNITSKKYQEMQVFEIKLKGNKLDEAALRLIDANIPYPILFILVRGDQFQAKLAYKEKKTKDENKTDVDVYFASGWQDELEFKLNGSSVDAIYAGMIQQIKPEVKVAPESDIRVAINVDKEREKIRAEIEDIKRQITREVQANKRQELARACFELEKRLKTL